MEEQQSKDRIFVARNAEVHIVDGGVDAWVEVEVLVNEWADGTRTVALREPGTRNRWSPPATLEEEK